jgi:tRNA (guanine9-N1)-methyltransferase
MESTQSLPTQRIAIDMGFDHLMNDKDVKNLIRQIERCYACNRRSANPFHMVLAGLSGKSQQRLEESVEGYQNWKNVTFEKSAFQDLFDKDSIVYLAAESENVLSEIDPTKVYVIGGFVDHNHHKGLSFSEAVAAGFHHARLPIDEYIKLSSRKVLTVNHVYEILMAFSETGDWQESFLHVLPLRKGVEVKQLDLETVESPQCQQRGEPSYIDDAV